MSTPNAVTAVMATADATRPWQEDLYRDLHSHPELSHEEHRTAGAVADRLSQFGFEVTTGVGGTGVVEDTHGKERQRPMLGQLQMAGEEAAIFRLQELQT